MGKIRFSIQGKISDILIRCARNKYHKTHELVIDLLLRVLAFATPMFDRYQNHVTWIIYLTTKET